MQTFWHAISLGFVHVIPFGVDHILFILCLYFSSTSLKKVLLLCTAFTITHSIALALAAYNFILPNEALVEPLIALSIFIMAIENILATHVKRIDALVVGFFGLIHGMGFASAFKVMQISASDFLTTLLGFNIGVEVGQLCVIVLAWIIIGHWFSNKPWYQSRIVYPISTLTACIAVYLIFTRMT